MMAKKKTTKDQDVKTGELLTTNPLMASPAITPAEENEKKAELINEIESLATINEQHLKVKQQQAKLEIELKKIEASRNLTNVIASAIDAGLSEKVLQEVSEKIKTPLDLKLFSEAIKNLTETRNKNADSIYEEDGRRKKTKIMAAFQTHSGEKMMISAELPSND